jgi:hypothetical protein
MNFVVDIDSYAEGAVLLDGFEDCIIGIVENLGMVEDYSTVKT